MLECQHAVLVTTPVHLRRMAASEGLAQVAPVCRALFSSGGPLEAETAASVAEPARLGAARDPGLHRDGRGRGARAHAVRRSLPPAARRARAARASRRRAGGDLALRERRPRHPHRRASLPDGRPRAARAGRQLRPARALGPHREDRGEAALAARDGEGSGPAPGGGRGGAAGAAAGLRAARARGRGAQRNRTRDPGPRGPPCARARARWRISRLAGTRCCCRGSGAIVDALPRNPQGKLPLAALAALFEPRDREATLQDETRGEGWLERRLEVPGDLAYLDGHYDGQSDRPRRGPAPLGDGGRLRSAGMDAAGPSVRGAQIPRGAAPRAELRAPGRAGSRPATASNSGSSRARACSRRAAAAWPRRRENRVEAVPADPDLRPQGRHRRGAARARAERAPLSGGRRREQRRDAGGAGRAGGALPLGRGRPPRAQRRARRGPQDRLSAGAEGRLQPRHPARRRRAARRRRREAFPRGDRARSARADPGRADLRRERAEEPALRTPALARDGLALDALIRRHRSALRVPRHPAGRDGRADRLGRDRRRDGVRSRAGDPLALARASDPEPADAGGLPAGRSLALRHDRGQRAHDLALHALAGGHVAAAAAAAAAAPRRRRSGSRGDEGGSLGPHRRERQHARHALRGLVPPHARPSAQRDAALAGGGLLPGPQPAGPARLAPLSRAGLGLAGGTPLAGPAARLPRGAAPPAHLRGRALRPAGGLERRARLAGGPARRQREDLRAGAGPGAERSCSARTWEASTCCPSSRASTSWS